MKIHTKNYKSAISTFGRELDSKITILNSDLVLEKEDLYSVNIITNTDLLKSVMKEVDFESKLQIGEKQEVNIKSGIKVNGKYEYINYGNYIVYKSEYKAETNSYTHICYDKMLNTMIDYTPLDITYPINLREYINTIATKCGLEFANIFGTFANYDTPINKDNFSNGNYTFRDVLDYVAELVGGWFCINDDDKLEIRYPSQAKNYESDSGEEINFYTEVEDKIKELTIYGKSIQETRSGKNLFNKNSIPKQNGATKEVLDTGVRAKLINSGNYRYFSIELGKSELLGKTITLTRTITNSASNIGQISLFFGNETSQSKKFIFSNRGSGTSNIYIPNTFPEDCDRIWVLFYGNVTGTGNVGDYTDYTDLMITLGDTLQNYEDYGVSPSPDYPSEIESVGTYNEETGKYEIEVKNTGKNLLNLPDGTYTHNGITAVISNGIITINGTSTAKSFLTIPINLELESNFSISLNNTAMGDSLSEVRLQISGSNFRSVSLSVANNKRENISIYGTYTSLLISISSGVTITNGIIKPQVELGYTTDYEPYQQNTSLFVLDQPLRSLPNGVKDIAYIKNNILYVDRNIRHLELPIADMNNNEDYPGWINQTQLKKDYPAVNNNFSYLSISLKSNITDDASAIGLNTNGSGVLFLRTTKFNLTQTQWKTNYSNLIFVLDYELAEPYTEKIGEVEMPSAFKGNNNITLSANINTNIDITYTKEYEEVDREFLKDVNVSFSKKYGPVNSIVFSRGGGSDNIYRKDYDSISANGLTEIKITDNPFLEDDERENFIQSVFDKLNGLEFYIMDVASTGITYLELGDLYYFNMSEDKPSLKAGLVQAGLRKAQGSSLGKYICLMLNDKIDITQGLSESIYADEPDITETDYKTASITDKSIKNAIIQTNKNSAEILLKVNSDEVVSAINLSPEKIKIQSSKIDVDGVLSVLGKAGSTVINGANITTGSINCDRLNGGTINGQAIRGGSISITTGNYYFNMGTSTSNPNCSGLNVGNYGIKAYSDITATGFAITDSDIGKSGTFILRHSNGTSVVYLTFTGGILTAYDQLD